MKANGMKIFAMSIIFIILFSANTFADSYSGQALEHSINASAQSAASIGNALLGSGQVSLAVSAAPLTILGEVGKVSGKAGEVLWEAATAEPQPLEISDENYTVGPPPEDALQTE